MASDIPPPPLNYAHPVYRLLWKVHFTRSKMISLMNDIFSLQFDHPKLRHGHLFKEAFYGITSFKPFLASMMPSIHLELVINALH